MNKYKDVYWFSMVVGIKFDIRPNSEKNNSPEGKQAYGNLEKSAKYRQ
jgi:hypothetical protein